MASYVVQRQNLRGLLDEWIQIVTQHCGDPYQLNHEDRIFIAWERPYVPPGGWAEAAKGKAQGITETIAGSLCRSTIRRQRHSPSTSSCPGSWYSQHSLSRLPTAPTGANHRCRVELLPETVYGISRRVCQCFYS